MFVVVQSPSWVQLLLHLPWLYKGFPCGSADRESACNAGDLGSVPGLGRSTGEGKGYPHQYSGLENSMDSFMGLQRVGHNWVTFTFTSWLYKDLYKFWHDGNFMGLILVCLYLKIIRKRWVLSRARWHQSQSSRPLRAEVGGKMLGPLQRRIQEYVQLMCFCLEPILTLSVIRTSS